MVLIDGAEPAALVTGSVMDMVSPLTRAYVLDFKGDGPGGPRLAMTHNGFDRLPGVTGYVRTLQLTDQGRTLECLDRVEGVGIHHLSASFHLDGRWSLKERRGHDLELKTIDHGDCVRAEFDPLWDSVDLVPTRTAPLYGQLVLTPAIRLEVSVSLPVALTTIFRYRTDRG